MKILFFCSTWGFGHMETSAFLNLVKSAGYDGIEAHPPLHAADREHLLTLLQEKNLLLIAQQYLEPPYPSFESYKKAFEKNLYLNASLHPVAINSHTGRDFFTFEQNLELIQLAIQIEQKIQVSITHETHRGRFSFSANNTHPYLESIPDLKFTADFSHWCCVSESLLEDQTETVAAICQNSYHIHARVGYAQSPQVPDPRDPRWAVEVKTHFDWWDKIVDARRQDGTEVLYVTPEFGPFPYMTLVPYSARPLFDQWDANVHMMRLFKNRYL